MALVRLLSFTPKHMICYRATEVRLPGEGGGGAVCVKGGSLCVHVGGQQPTVHVG